MANKKINELPVRVPSLTDLMIVGDPFTGYSYKSTLTSLSTLISSSLSGTYVPNTRTLTVNGTTYDLSANRSWSVGTVTSIAVSAGTGISVSGSPITSSGTITITNSAPDQVVALTAGTGISISGTYPNFTIVNSSPSLGGTVTSVGLSVPTGLTISGSPITTSGTLALGLQTGYSIPTTASQANWDAAYNDKINNAAVTGTTTKTLTLTQQDGGTVTASWSDLNTDAVTSVFGRTGAVVAASGDYTTAQVTESTNLYYTDARARGSISAGTGISYSSTTGVIASTITQYTDALARAAISLTTTGSSGSATYSSLTGVLNVPTYTLAGLGGISLSSLSATLPLSYNSGTGQFSISQANSTTNGFLSSTDWNTFNNKQSAITLTTTGSSGASTFISNTLNIPTYTLAGLGGEPAITAGTTSQYFRGDKTFQTLNTAAVTESTNLYFTNTRARAAISLTTTGTSGAATYDNSTGVLNIPQYSGGGGSGTVSGTTNYIAKFTSSTAVGNSLMFDTGTGIVIGNGQSSATPQLGLIEGTDGSGTNIAGAEFRIQGGQGTGTGAGGAITFYTSAAGTSGSATNSATERMRIDASGNVGIVNAASAWAGTNINALQIGNASIYRAGNFETGYSVNTYYDGTNFRYISTGIATNYTIVNGIHAWQAVASGTAGATFSWTRQMTLDASGNLGINTTTIGSKLQVNGSAAIGYSASTAAPTNGLAVAGNVGIGIAAPATNLHVYRTTAGLSGMQVSNLTHGSTITDGMFVGVDDTQGYIYMYENLPIQLSTNSTVRLFINNDGTVFVGGTNAPASPTTGILSGSGATGTNVAGAELRIRGGASTGSAAGGPITFYTSASGTAGTTTNNAVERMRITSGGDVGIGTTSPGANLHIKASGTSTVKIQGSAATGFDLQNDAVGAYLWNRDNTQMYFGTNNTERMRITSGGSVGIGTTTIGSTLQVNGNAAIGYSASTAAPTNGLAVAGDILGAGNVRSSNGTVNMAISWQTGPTYGIVGTFSNHDVSVWTNGSQKMLISTGGQVTLNTGANVSAIAQTGYSLTGSNASSLLDLAGTWNTTGNPTALKLNITNTASGASAYLMDLQVGGVTQFRVTKAGAIRTTSPSGGTANDWKFGSRFATTVALDTTQYLEVEVGGTFYRVGIVSAL